jgi:hypothetical protein
MESSTQMAHAFTSVLWAVAHLEMRLPPKIFVVQRVVVVEEVQIISQLIFVFKFGGVDERMRRRY